ncbi:DUF3696 domain-containing protein [bacterium]|nr:DUF3696 domain-containing protein [bacterium]
MLRRLELGNFKSWERLEMDLKPITLIFGANSSGKTAILDSLLMLKQTAESTDRGRSIAFRGAYRDYGSFADLIHRHDSSRPLRARVDWVPRPHMSFTEPERENITMGEVRYEAEWRLDGDVDIHHLAYALAAPRFRFSLDRQDSSRYAGTLTSEDGPVLLDVGFPTPESCYALPRAVSSILPGYSLLELNRQFELVTGRTRYLGPIRERPRRVYQWSGEVPGSLLEDGSSAVDALIASVREVLTDYDGQPGLIDEAARWLRESGLATRLMVTPIGADTRYHEVKLVVPGADDVETVLPDVGFGVSQLLPVLVQMLFAPQGSILLFEQPEIHLHPRAAAELADLFIEVAGQRDLQLIIETHSEYLLSRLQRRIAEAQSELASPENIAIYFCELREGASHLEPIRLNEYGQIENWPNDFFGDSIGDLEAMTKAMLARRRQGG